MMTTKRIWALAAVLSSAACTSSSGEGTLNAAQDSTAGKGAMDASVAMKGDNAAANGGSAGNAATKPGGNVSTGNPSSAGSAAPKTGASGAAAARTAGSAGKTGAAGKAGSAGSAGNAADDSDAGTSEEMGSAPTAGRGGSSARSGAAGAAGTMAGAGGAGVGADKPATKTLDVPKDPAQRGPWPVGVRTLDLDLGNGLKTPVEVWYPAKPGSEGEQPKVSYDLTAWLPPEHGIPAEAPKVHIDCDCYREIAPDLDHGPFPIVVIVHGQASFRAASASQMTHWASRGYIAIAADHPGLLMRDRLAGNGCTGSGIPQDVAHTRDVPAIFRELAQPEGIFSFLKGALDAERVALGGHGDGASYASDNLGQPGVKAILSFSHANVVPPPAEPPAGVFYLTGQSDKIEAYNTVLAAYDATSRAIRPALLAGMANVGHLGFTDLCGARNSDGQDAIAMARRYDICGGAAINVADQYFWDCPLSPLAGPDNYLDQAKTTALVQKLSTIALEELLLGQAHAQEWADVAADKTWGELRQTR